MGDRFASHAISGSGRIPAAGPAPESAVPEALVPGPEAVGVPDGHDVAADHDWVEAMASLDDCDGYVVLMVDPQTAEVDAHGPYGGPDAAVAAEMLTSSLAEEGLDDIVVRIVRLHLPAASAA